MPRLSDSVDVNFDCNIEVGTSWEVEGEVEGGGRGGGGVQVQPRKRMRWSANGGIITHHWGSEVGGACYAPM